MPSDPRLDLPIDDSYFKILSNLAKKTKIQYFNARFSAAISTNIGISRGNIKAAHFFNSYGFSIQTFTNGGWGFAVSNNINREEVEKKFNESAKLAKFSSTKCEKAFSIDELDPLSKKIVQPQKKNLLDVDQKEKLAFIMEQDKKARGFDKKIVNTNSSYSDTVRHQIIFTSDQRIIDSQESYARALVATNSKDGPIKQSGRESIGITGGFEIIDLCPNMGEKAAKKAIELLSAKPVIGGKYNIIADPLLTGTFIHEAFGHACEADLVLAEESILKDKIGEKLGPEFINIIDDPGKESFYGSIIFDSECIQAKKVQLVKDGILNEFMHNRETSSKMNVAPTGNGRSQSYKSVPVVRMTSTYLEPGNWQLEEMIEELKEGLLCENWKYGYANPSVGDFQFKMERAWKIEKGEKAYLLRDAALSGMMLEALNKITAISKEIIYDDGACGKSGQHVPVSSGGPYIRINDNVIGGI